MKWLLTSDLHLSDKPRDEYRFGLFRWMAKQQAQHGITHTFILGDCTENKDRHSAKLVNRTIEELARLKPPVYILRGNHDGVDPANPFFGFLNAVDGFHFIIEPEEVLPGVFMIPHQRTQTDFDTACKIIKRTRQQEVLRIMLHATFAGAQAETGSRLSGLSTAPIESLRPRACWAGDVHKPQQCGPVTYLGAPYHIRFGDNYQPRVLLVQDIATANTKDLHFDSPRKWALTITGPEQLKQLRKGDQAKLTVKITREELVEWVALKQNILAECKNLGVDVYGLDMEVSGEEQHQMKPDQTNALTPQDVLKAYCKAEGVGVAIRNAGMELL